VQRLVQELDETAANTALILFNPKLVDMQDPFSPEPSLTPA
jgi:hypothetical protein